MALVQMMDRLQQVDHFTAEDVAARLNVSKYLSWDHPSQRLLYLPVIWMSDGTLRYLQFQKEDWKEETAKIKKYLIRAALLNEFYLSAPRRDDVKTWLLNQGSLELPPRFGSHLRSLFLQLVQGIFNV